MRINRGWFLLTLFEVTLIILCQIIDFDTILMMTCILWFNLIAYSLSRINERSVLLAFMLSFFAFLMGRQVLEAFGIHERVEIFPADVEHHAEIMLLISIVGFFIGYMCTITNSNEVDIIDNYHDYEYKIIRRVSSTYFYITIIILLISTLESAIYVMKYGYLESYVAFRSRIPYPIRMIGETSIVSLFIYLATLPKKEEIRGPILVFCLYLCATLGTGKRFMCIAGFLILICYYSFRDYYDNDNSWLDIKQLMRVAVVGILLIVLSYIVGKLRLNQHNEYYTISRIIMEFIYEQGVSINVVKRSYQYSYLLHPNRLYMFGTIIRILTSNAIARLLGFISFSGNTVENAINGYSLAHSLSYIVMGQQYLDGGGTGSSYIAEVFYSFSYFGVLCANVFYGAICKSLLRFWRRGLVYRTLVLLILQQFFFAPRGNFDGFIGPLLDIKTWATIIIILMISKQYSVGRSSLSLENK